MVPLKAMGGTRDILPEETAQWQQIEGKARGIMALYGYQEIRTPLMEDAAVFTRSLGEAAEIVTKQMYLFQDRGGRSVALRPEGTAPVVRAFIEHGLDKTAGVARLYYMGPMFRAERPQAGRRRQFHQIGVEVFGSASPYQDAEVMALLMRLLRALTVKVADGPGDEEAVAVLKLNHLGCRECRPEWLKRLKPYLAEHLNDLCEECRERFRVNPLRILDCKKERCQGIFRRKHLAASERLCASCQRYADQVKKGLKELRVYFEWDDHLVRGLDYYTGTVFEVSHDALGEKAQSAIAAGGRYDDLVREMGGAATPAVGFAVGLERVLMVCGPAGAAAGSPDRMGAFVATVSPAQIPEAVALVEALRDAGVPACANLEERPLNRQLATAAKWMPQGTVLILGEEEIRQGVVTVKELSTGQQRQVPRSELVASVFRR